MKKTHGSKHAGHRVYHKSDLAFSIFFCAAGLAILFLLLTFS